MRKQAYRIVYETMEKNGHSNEVFHQIILGEKKLAARDKSFLKRLGYGTIERAVELDGYLDQVSRIPVRKMDGEVRTVLRMAMYEILYMEQVPEAVSCHEAAELIRWAGKEGQVSFVNGPGTKMAQPFAAKTSMGSFQPELRQENSWKNRQLVFEK